MVNLFPHHSLLLLEFLLGDLFLAIIFGLGNCLFALGQDDLNVAGRAHVGVDAAVGAVCPPAHLGSTVHLNVLNDKVVSVQALQGEEKIILKSNAAKSMKVINKFM
jgi:hypothetical protein